MQAFMLSCSNTTACVIALRIALRIALHKTEQNTSLAGRTFGRRTQFSQFEISKKLPDIVIQMMIVMLTRHMMERQEETGQPGSIQGLISEG